MTLEELRKQIDAIDSEIVERLNARVRLASEIGRLKKERGEEIYVPSREQQVFEKIAALNGGPLEESALRFIYREIISASIRLEEEIVIAYLGPEGTFTQQAAVKNFGSSQKYRALNTIPDVITEVERGEANYGVFPIENSTGGAVNHSQERLVESDLKIIAQVFLKVEHCLISNHPLEAIEVVYSKDQALNQCRDWLRRHLPRAKQVEVDSTSKGVVIAKETEGAAAIAGILASEQHRVPVVAENIQDANDNSTRFLVIGRAVSPPTGNGRDRTSIVFTIRDEVAALQKALEPFSSRGINLCKIESRPSRRKAWDYYFFVDLIGHYDDPDVKAAMAELEQRCPFVKWLGSYPNATA
ncbi:MAG: prephenate dehydratase [Opitutales bacterium]